MLNLSLSVFSGEKKQNAMFKGSFFVPFTANYECNLCSISSKKKVFILSHSSSLPVF